MSVKAFSEDQLNTLEKIGMSKTDVAFLDGLTGGNSVKKVNIIVPQNKLSGKFRLLAHSINSAIIFAAKKLKLIK